MSSFMLSQSVSNSTSSLFSPFVWSTHPLLAWFSKPLVIVFCYLAFTRLSTINCLLKFYTGTHFLHGCLFIAIILLTCWNLFSCFGIVLTHKVTHGHPVTLDPHVMARSNLDKRNSFHGWLLFTSRRLPFVIYILFQILKLTIFIIFYNIVDVYIIWYIWFFVLVDACHYWHIDYYAVKK